MRLTFEHHHLVYCMPIDASFYAQAHTAALSPLLQQLLQQTAMHPHAHMVSGHTQGVFLQMLSNMMQPAAVLEIGTFTGFSALCLADGLAPDGVIHTIELRAEDAATAQTFFARSSHAHQIIQHVGDARHIIPTLPPVWDLVFLDADKVSYIEYYEMVLPRLRRGGFLLADNVLFHGEVLEEPVKGKNAKAIAAFNAHVLADTRSRQVLLTVRDGLLLVQKL